MISITDFVWSIIGAFLVAFLLGLNVHSIGDGHVRERTMVEFNLAHYHEKTKEFVADSLEFKNDTIIIRKKSN